MRTWIARLSLTDFRSYAALSLGLDSRIVVLTGANGSGKTNCLEALSLLNPGRGLRGQPYSLLPRQGGGGGWAVAVRVTAGAEAFALGTGQQPPAPGEPPSASRAIRVDGAPARSARALAERVRLVWLTPSMDGLFTGPASDRRRFLDRMVLGVDPSFSAPSAAFEKAMRHRNRALEEFAPPRVLDALETQMAQAAAAILIHRRNAVQALAALGQGVDIAGGQAASAFPGFRLRLDGDLEKRAEGGQPAAEIEAWYRQRLHSGRDRDRAAKRTLTGPHRSDLLVVHGPKDMPAALCSTGEQKALLLGLVLAQARLIKSVNRGIAPLILLDEVAAHLDAVRREALFEEIVALDAQAWMTGTDRLVFAPLEDSGTAQVFVVSNGAIRHV